MAIRACPPALPSKGWGPQRTWQRHRDGANTRLENKSPGPCSPFSRETRGMVRRLLLNLTPAFQEGFPASAVPTQCQSLVSRQSPRSPVLVSLPNVHFPCISSEQPTWKYISSMSSKAAADVGCRVWVASFKGWGYTNIHGPHQMFETKLSRAKPSCLQLCRHTG